MARIVTLQLLVDADNEAEIADGINETLREHLRKFSPDSFIIDYRLAGMATPEPLLYTAPVSPKVEAAIVAGEFTEDMGFTTMQMALPLGRNFAMAHDPTGAAQREGEDRLYVEVFAHPEPDFPIGAPGSIAVTINRTHEGVIVDLYASGTNRCIGTACAEFSDASAAQVDVHDLDSPSLHANHRGFGPHS